MYSSQTTYALTATQQTAISTSFWETVYGIPPTLKEKEVVRMLIGLTSTQKNVANKKLILGSTLYELFRQMLVDRHIIIPYTLVGVDKNDTRCDKKHEKKRRPEKKSIALQKIQTTKRVMDAIVAVSSHLMNNDIKSASAIAFDLPWIETNAMGLMIIARTLIDTLSSDTKEIWTMMVAIERFLLKCENYHGKDPIDPMIHDTPISPLFISDLRTCYSQLLAKFGFDGRVIIMQAPDIVYGDNQYDTKVLPSVIKPRCHQDEMIRFIANHPTCSYIVCNNAMTGSGKTTTLGALGILCAKNKRLLLAVCAVPAVRAQFGRQMLIAGAHMALAIVNDHGIVELKRPYSTKHVDKQVDVIITDPVTACKVLSCAQNLGIDPSQLTLFLDNWCLTGFTSFPCL